MGCVASANADSHKGFNFLLPKWIDKNKVKEADSEELQRQLFLEYAPGHLWTDARGDLEKLTNDQLTEATIPYLWLGEQHYFSRGELAKMSMAEQKAALLQHSAIPEAPMHEMPAKLAATGTFLNFDKLTKDVKHASLAASFQTPADQAAQSDDDVKKVIKENLVLLLADPQASIDALDDAKLIDACFLVGFIRGAALVPDAELKQMDLNKARGAVLAATAGVTGWGLGDIAKNKDMQGYDLCAAAKTGKKSLSMEPFGKAYQPETEEDKKKKEEARKKKADEKAAAAEKK